MDIKYPENFDLTAEDLCKKLLNRNPNFRLGANNKYEDLKKHPFFKNIDFKNIHL